MNKINKSFRLSLIGFDSRQTETFLAVLSLAERGLQHSWRVCEPAHADFFLLATEKSQSEALITEHKLQRERCLFCSTEKSADSDVLLVDAKKVPRLGALIELLNQLANIDIFEQSIYQSDTELIPEEEQVSVFNQEHEFFEADWGFLNELLKATEPRIFHCVTINRKIYVNPLERIYYYSGNLKELEPCLTVEQGVIAENCSNSQWHTEVSYANLIPKPLSNLIWYISFKLSKGRLLRGHSTQDSVYLTRWPDLGIEGCGKYIKLAAFMRHNSVPLPLIAEYTKISLAEVYGFYNACYLIGIVGKTKQAELRTKVLDENKQALFAKITERLKKIDNRK